MLARLINLYPVWVLLAAVGALIEPGVFAWFSGPWIVWGLAVIMLGMGLTLTFADFRAVARRPRGVALAFLAQYTIMPLLGWTLATLLRLDPPFAVGLILVSCCPGGTASNLVAFLARADVAFSVVATMASTFAAAIMTPVLTKWLAGTLVAVDGWALVQSTAQVVLAPVMLGVLLNRFLPRLVSGVKTAAPLASVLACALIVGNIVGENAAAIRASAASLLLAIFLLHSGGFAVGYAAGWLCGYPRRIARTLAIEVGMQNSGLGVVLARRHFADPLTAVPCAISAVCHSILGSILAGYFRLRPDEVPAPDPVTRKAATTPTLSS